MHSDNEQGVPRSPRERYGSRPWPLEPLRAVDTTKPSIERAEREMTGLARDLQDQAVREPKGWLVSDLSRAASATSES
jgi:hypothetical protein